MKSNLKHFIAVWLLCSWRKSSAQDSDCSKVMGKNVTAYFGWPVTLSCDELVENCESLYEMDILTFCQMTDLERNETLLNVSYNPFQLYNDVDYDLSYQIPAVTSESPTNILVKISSDDEGCCSQRVTLDTEELSNYTCGEASNLTENVVTRSITQGEAARLLCQPQDDSDQSLASDFNVTWYYNCERGLPPNVEPMEGKLLINSTDYRYHPGIYTCSVKNDEGQERFLVAHRVCVEPVAWSDVVTMLCPENLFYNLGDTVNITCEVDIGIGGINPDSYSMRYYPLLKNGSLDVSKDNISCTSLLGRNRTTNVEDDRVSCIFSYAPIAPDLTCFGYIPTEQAWETERNKTISKLSMSYKMKQVRREDFGTFFAEVKNRISGEKASDNTTVQEAVHPGNIALIIGCTIGAVFLLFIIPALIYFWFGLEIRYWWRQTFAKEEKEPREYGAYLSYTWVKEDLGVANDNECRERREQLKNFITSLKEFLEGIRCPVYDAIQNQQPGLPIYKTIAEAQQDSDRVVIVLSPEYLEDPQNVFERFKNFLDTPFVFIKTPRADDSIKGLKKEYQNALMLQLKRSVVINWTPNDKDHKQERENGVQAKSLPKKFCMKLELAMPKRPAPPVIYENGDVRIPDRTAAMMTRL